MTAPSPSALKGAMAYLLGAGAEDAAGLPPLVDYPAVVKRAADCGFETDAAAIEEAFRVLMRMRNTRHPR